MTARRGLDELHLEHVYQDVCVHVRSWGTAAPQQDSMLRKRQHRFGEAVQAHAAKQGAGLCQFMVN